jgi:hypothetical protein
VAAPWLPNERQIKAKIYLAYFSSVIPGHRAAMNPESARFDNFEIPGCAIARPGMTAVQ